MQRFRQLCIGEARRNKLIKYMLSRMLGVGAERSEAQRLPRTPYQGNNRIIQRYSIIAIPSIRYTG